MRRMVGGSRKRFDFVENPFSPEMIRKLKGDLSDSPSSYLGIWLFIESSLDEDMYWKVRGDVKRH